MLVSMTGCGSATRAEDDFVVAAEVKSLNSRYLEPIVKLHPLLNGFELEFVKLIRKYVSRGRVNLTVNVLQAGREAWNLSIDENLLEAYTALIQEIDSRLTPEQTVVCLDRFIQMPELIMRTPDPEVQEKLLEVSLRAVEEALIKLQMSRKEEGRAIQRDISKRLKRLSGFIKTIKELKDKALHMRTQKLREQITQLAENSKIDENRLVQEITYYAIRSDFTEEITRLEAHLDRLYSALRSRKPTGSILNFTLQECLREINTIGSKNDLLEISQIVIDFKEELERIREQVQNVE